LRGRITESVVFAVEVEIVISHGLFEELKISNSGAGMCFFFFRNSTEMTGGVVWEKTRFYIHKQQKIVLSQIHVPNASIGSNDVSNPEQEGRLTTEI
jgi:hypothetical protein